ncbi:hypothetical protein BN2537_17275 [Streptomyces venezuelae]|nr:hypothetical protein BN2537_17275 [Streptomyces venezuelae]
MGSGLTPWWISILSRRCVRADQGLRRLLGIELEFERPRTAEWRHD